MLNLSLSSIYSFWLERFIGKSELMRAVWISHPPRNKFCILYSRNSNPTFEWRFCPFLYAQNIKDRGTRKNQLRDYWQHASNRSLVRLIHE